MPITQGTGSFSTGRDCRFVLIGPFGTVDIPNVTDFDAKPIYKDIDIDRLDGVQMFASLPKGWNVSLSAERGSQGLDLMCAAIETAWRTNGTYIVGTGYQYIAESDGSTSVWQFSSCAIKLDNPGAWKGDMSVKQSISIKADLRSAV